MAHGRLVLRLLALCLLVGCSKSPTVTLSVAANADLPQPDNMTQMLNGQLKQAILQCYRDSGSKATGTTVVEVRGSHGLLDLTAKTSSGTDVLDACAADTISGARMARQLGDTESFIGFVLTVEYSQD